MWLLLPRSNVVVSSLLCCCWFNSLMESWFLIKALNPSSSAFHCFPTDIMLDNVMIWQDSNPWPYVTWVELLTIKLYVVIRRIIFYLCFIIESWCIFQISVSFLCCCWFNSLMKSWFLIKALNPSSSALHCSPTDIMLDNVMIWQDSNPWPLFKFYYRKLMYIPDFSRTF